MADAQNPSGHVADQAALDTVNNPQEGDVYITDDTGDAWAWSGTVWVDQKEVAVPFAAPAPGTAIVGTTTIDALFTTAFGTRSADCGTPTYRWGSTDLGKPTIQALFTAGTSVTALNGSMITCSFEARPLAPTTITP